MLRLLAVASTLLLAAPVWAASFTIYESSLGGPNVTASFGNGSGLIANIDYDADSAENGGLLFGGPSEIEIVPLGDIVFSAWTCELSNCDFSVFTAGGEGVGSLEISSANASAETGIIDLGLLEFDIPLGLGTIELLGCNYTDGAGNEPVCDPFTLVQVPEPGAGLLLGLGVGALAIVRRRRSA